MDDLKRFEAWARRARREAPPGVHVADAVLGRLRRMSPPVEAGPPPAAWLAFGLAAAAALVMAVVGFEAWRVVSDPLSGWVRDFGQWGML